MVVFSYHVHLMLEPLSAIIYNVTEVDLMCRSYMDQYFIKTVSVCRICAIKRLTVMQ